MDSGLLTLFCLIFVVLTALSGLIGVIQHIVRRRRLARIREWAAHNGWAVTDSPGAERASRLPGANAKGVLVELSAVVDGRPVAVGEYTHRYGTAGVGTGSTGPVTLRYVFAGVRLREQYPVLAVRRKEQPGISFRRALGLGGPPALGFEPFDRKFSIEAPDPSQIHRWLSPPVVNEHLAGRAPQWVLRGSELLVYWEDRLTPDAVPRFAATAVWMAQLLRLT